MPRPLAALFRSRAARLITLTLAVLYPTALLASLLTLRLVGERWWVTTVALYLPRLPFLVPLPFLLGALLLTSGDPGRGRRPFWALLATSAPIFLALMGFVVPRPTSPDRSRPTLRVLSYNVNSTYGGAANVIAVIEKYSPDVVLLEEVGFAYAVEPLLRERYPTVQVVDEFIVASRFPIASSVLPDKEHYFARSPRWMQQVIETSIGPVAVYIVHFQSPREGLDAVRSGIRRDLLDGRPIAMRREERVKRNAALRGLQVHAVAEAARRESGAVLIAGDTNLPSLSLILNRELAGFQDGFTKAGWGFGYTFPTTRGDWMRIDRMFANDELRFVHFEVGDSPVSDHDCIVADLQRAP